MSTSPSGRLLTRSHVLTWCPQVFRTNSSYARWEEGRRLWGQVLNRTRDVCRLVRGPAGRLSAPLFVWCPVQHCRASRTVGLAAHPSGRDEPCLACSSSPAGPGPAPTACLACLPSAGPGLGRRGGAPRARAAAAVGARLQQGADVPPAQGGGSARGARGGRWRLWCFSGGL